MARNLRVEYPGAIYHVLNRGDRREPIFIDYADRQRFVETLGEMIPPRRNRRYGVRSLAPAQPAAAARQTPLEEMARPQPAGLAHRSADLPPVSASDAGDCGH